MKSKNNDVHEVELEHDENEDSAVEVEAGGPAIAAAKKSKITIIAASSILVTLVLYFMFFKDSGVKQQTLVEVAPPKPVAVAPSEDGKSVFELEQVDKSKEDLELLQKPAAPEVPTLPILPEGTVKNNEPTLPEAKATDDLVKQLTPPEIKEAVQNNLNQEKSVDNKSKNKAEDNKAKAESKEEDSKDMALDPRFSPIIVASAPNQGGPALGVGYDNNIVQLKKDSLDNLEQTQAKVKTTYISDLPHTIAQGKLFTAVLETAINTEIPGFVRAIISRDVYGESGKDVLIPRGSRLFGSYSSQITRGQGRVEIAWTRLIRPDGVDLAITFNASDQFGRSGIAGETDNKYGAVIANSMLTSILAVGSVAAAQKLLTNNQQTVTTNNPQQGTVTTTGSASNQALYDVSKTIVDTVGRVINNTIDLQPIIRVPQGTRITVIVNADIKIPSMNRR